MEEMLQRLPVQFFYTKYILGCRFSLSQELFLGGNLLCDLKLLLTAEHDRLQHLVGADVGLEVLHIPQFSDQLSKPVLHN